MTSCSQCWRLCRQSPPLVEQPLQEHKVHTWKEPVLGVMPCCHHREIFSTFTFEFVFYNHNLMEITKPCIRGLELRFMHSLASHHPHTSSDWFLATFSFRCWKS